MKEGNVLFNNTINTFYIRLYGVGLDLECICILSLYLNNYGFKNKIEFNTNQGKLMFVIYQYGICMLLCYIDLCLCYLKQKNMNLFVIFFHNILFCFVFSLIIKKKLFVIFFH